MNEPTNSHTSVSLQQPIGTSKFSCPVFLTHDSEFWKSRVFLDSIIMDKSCSVTFIDDCAKFNASVKSFSIEGQKFSTSKFINGYCFLLLIFLNQLIESEVFFHWFTFALMKKNFISD